MPDKIPWHKRLIRALPGGKQVEAPSEAVFGEEGILRSPAFVARDAHASEPLRLVLEQPHQSRRTKLAIATFVCIALAIVAGLVVWLGGYYGPYKNNPGFWHVSLVSVLFWLSISQGMVALSCLLRITHASWRYPLNRMLDMASLFGVSGIVLLPFLVVARRQIYALGSSDYRDNVWRVSGPVEWDALAVGIAFLVGWLLLYLTSLPDFAILRDRAPDGSPEKKFYTRLTRLWAGTYWTGAEHQWRVLRRCEGMLVVGVVASFMASQTVLGWDFQLAAARNWDSSIFAPLFTLGSLLGGTAMTVLVMTVVQRVLRGRGFFNISHYDNLGRLMIGLGLIWFYFRWCDYLTAWYGHIPAEWYIQNNRTVAFPILATIMVLGCFAIPVFGNMIGAIRRTVAGVCSISICVLIGLAVQRYLDTVPTFAPNYPLSALVPTVRSLSVFVGVAALFVLTYLLAARYFPIISWWGTSKERTRTSERTLGNAVVTVIVEDPPVWET